MRTVIPEGDYHGHEGHVRVKFAFLCRSINLVTVQKGPNRAHFGDVFLKHDAVDVTCVFWRQF